MFDWQQIDTVLLDMDGTLLDLHYDNYFWLQHLPACYAKAHAISHAQAEAVLYQHYQAVAGSLDWYCLDHWSQVTQLDVRALKSSPELSARIAWRADSKDFLSKLSQLGIQRVLLTNCHPDGLELKIQQTAIDTHLDRMFSTHQFGYPKEAAELWSALQKSYPFDPSRCLFVDDNEHLLDAASNFGIAYTLGIKTPDSQNQSKVFERHRAVDLYNELFDPVSPH
ncbi:GMP/IMP nucleotidase [Alginatibacterium sediminis]|uniref:GMP/IMP nucleotidase n=1 Tax=Alginatibacterium sediminis TaxID=2164068 RepID=A0A420E625_9ALTE|nr:GMP/IMP nucleotidase [Alginatibacterium sediminis]RKF13188.1 GMP/IMP nucleotidase [Alginatibacterium sediminis]